MYLTKIRQPFAQGLLIAAALCPEKHNGHLHQLTHTHLGPASQSFTDTHHGVLQLCVRVIYRTPRSYICLRVARLLSMACPPSTPINEAMRLRAIADSMSAVEVAKENANV